MSTLFRKEAVLHATRRLEGDVLLTTPISLRIYTSLCVAIVLCVSLYLTQVTFARTEQVVGWLVPHGGILRVLAHSGGTVDQLFVKEGDIVRAGQTLARLRLSTALASGEDSGIASGEALASQASALQAEAAATRAKLASEQSDLAPKVRDLTAERGELRKQIALQLDQIRIAESDYKRFQVLADGGYIASRLVDDRRAALLSAEQSLSQLRSNDLAIEQQISDVNARLHAIPSDLQVAEANARSASAEIVEKKIQSNSQTMDTLVASVDGRVLAIPIAQGQSLAAGATVAVVAPKGAYLEAELYAPSRAIGFVEPGQDVHVMYQAFPHEKFGTERATIASISTTILAPNEVAIPGVSLQQPVFRMRARLAEQGVHAYGRLMTLQPGMLLSANILFDRRTLFEWLLDPIYAVQK